MLTQVSSSSGFVWTIEDFSTLDAQEGFYSDVFLAGGFEWKAQIYPKGYERVYDHLSVFLVPADSTKFPLDEVECCFAITSQTNSNSTVRIELKHTFTEKTCTGWGEPSALRLSELHDSSKGYIVNDSCVIKLEVCCSVNSMQIKPKNGVDVVEHRGKPFEEGRHNVKGGFREGLEYEDVGGFSVFETQASLYKQIWAKYGHIPSTKVVPISSYSVLVTVVKDLMSCVIDMHQCRFVELSTEMVEVWEEKIKMAEKLEFNISWLRERFETVKKGVCGMQKFKTELLEHGQPLRVAKLKVKAIGDEMKKVEVELTAAKDYVRENASGLLSESDVEMYLEMGENLLFDGMF